MTEPKAKSASASKDAPKKSEPAEGAPRYTKERLMADSITFIGQPAHVLAGALHGDDREELTVAEAKKAAEDWLGSSQAEEE